MIINKNKMNILKVTKLISGGLIALGSLYAIYKTGRIYLIRRKYRHIPGPETKGIMGFFFGNALELMEIEVFAQFLLNYHEKYGEVFKYQLFDQVIISTINQESIRDIFVIKNYPKSPFFYRRLAFVLGERFLGKGLVTDLDPVRWRHRRTIFNPGFHKNVLITFVNQFNAIADLLMERFRTLAETKSKLSLLTEMNHAALDAIAQIAFGMNIDTINHKNKELNDSILYTFSILNQEMIDPFAKLKIKLAGKYGEFRKQLDLLRNTGRHQIIERINAMKNQDYVPTDILSRILKDLDGDDLELESFIDDFVTFFIAGQETTATTVSFVFMELGRNNEAFRKAREEVNRVLGNRAEISYQDSIDLKYINAILKETLRLYSVVPLLARITSEDTEINEYKIPAGTNINASSYISGRWSKFFAEPQKFKPERFLKDQNSTESSIQNYTYFPFSVGPRNCIGQNFAQIEAVILIAKIIQQFDFELDKDETFKVAQSGTIRPQSGTKMFISLRS